MSYYHYTEPIDWGLTTSLLILAAVVIGGAKSIIGVLLGTVAVFTINTLFLQQITFFRENSNFINIFTGILIIVIVMFFPGGLYHLGLILKMKFIDLKKKIVEKLNKSKLERKEQYYGKDEEYRTFETISYWKKKTSNKILALNNALDYEFGYIQLKLFNYTQQKSSRDESYYYHVKSKRNKVSLNAINKLLEEKYWNLRSAHELYKKSIKNEQDFEKLSEKHLKELYKDYDLYKKELESSLNNAPLEVYKRFS